MINKHDIQRLAVEHSMSPWSPNDEWIQKTFNMDDETFLDLVEAMLETSLRLVTDKTLEDGPTADILLAATRASLIGALYMGVQLERQFGNKMATPEM